MRFIVRPKKQMNMVGCNGDCSSNCIAKCNRLGTCFCPLDR
ncbi:MAG: hypothetical protein ACI4F9_10320 [Lachnospiraceae bacterium]